MNSVAGADSGFSVGVAADPLPNFPKNCMKLKKNWAVGGRVVGMGETPPLEPLLGSVVTTKI